MQNQKNKQKAKLSLIFRRKESQFIDYDQF